MKIQSLPAWPNIKTMTQIPGSDEYEFSGETPDIWFELQVYKYQMISAYQFDTTELITLASIFFNLVLIFNFCPSPFREL